MDMISASFPMQTKAMEDLAESRHGAQFPAPLLTVMKQARKCPTGLRLAQLSGITPNRVQQVLLGLIVLLMLRGKKLACALAPLGS